MAETIVFIHGAWLASNSWERFATFFAERGYATLTPEWPRKAPDVAAQREDPAALAGLGVEEIVEHYTAIVDALDEPPIIIGHSFGGLITQILVGRGHGRAAVALDPAAPKGIKRVPLSSLRAAAPAIAHPSTRHGTVDLDFDQFNYAFTNTWETEAARQRLTATRCRRPGGSSSRTASPTSRSTARPRSTSTARSAGRC